MNTPSADSQAPLPATLLEHIARMESSLASLGESVQSADQRTAVAQLTDSLRAFKHAPSSPSHPSMEQKSGLLAQARAEAGIERASLPEVGAPWQASDEQLRKFAQSVFEGAAARPSISLPGHLLEAQALAGSGGANVRWTFNEAGLRRTLRAHELFVLELHAHLLAQSRVTFLDHLMLLAQSSPRQVLVEAAARSSDGPKTELLAHIAEEFRNAIPTPEGAALAAMIEEGVTALESHIRYAFSCQGQPA